jgi:hypothetical protein
MFAALQVGCLHIASKSVGRRDLKVGVPSCEHVNKFAVRDDACRAIAFGYPLRDVSSDDVRVNKLSMYLEKLSDLPKLSIGVRAMTN